MTSSLLQSSELLIIGKLRDDSTICGRSLPLIDRRFYRQKYNAEQALADFAATARDETDLEALSGKLVQVVQETMQPESVNLWLRPSIREKIK
jgi:hypothetical protein